MPASGGASWGPRPSCSPQLASLQRCLPPRKSLPKFAQLPACWPGALAPAGTMFEAGLAWAVLPRLGWRWLLALSAAPLLLLLLLYPWLPESPHWLMVRGRHQEAEAVVLRVATVNRYGRQMRLDFGGGGRHGGKWALERDLGLPDSPGSSPLDLLGQGEAAALGAARERRHAGEDGGGGGGSGSAGSVSSGGSSPRRGAVRRGRRRLPGSGRAGEGENGGGGSGEAAAGKAGEGLEEIERTGAGWSAKRLWREMRAAFRQLFGPRLLRTTLLLYIIW